MIVFLLFISEDSRHWRKDKTWTDYKFVWVFLRQILRQLVSVGSLNTRNFTHPPQNIRRLPFEFCKPKTMLPQKLNLSSMLVICHQRILLYGVIQCTHSEFLLMSNIINSRFISLKGLTSWLSFVLSNCEFVTFPLVSWVRCGTWLYRFLIFAPLLT